MFYRLFSVGCNMVGPMGHLFSLKYCSVYLLLSIAKVAPVGWPIGPLGYLWRICAGNSGARAVAQGGPGARPRGRLGFLGVLRYGDGCPVRAWTS